MSTTFLCHLFYFLSVSFYFASKFFILLPINLYLRVELKFLFFYFVLFISYAFYIFYIYSLFYFLVPSGNFYFLSN